jgi:2-dehydropantoate 2-reductase
MAREYEFAILGAGALGSIVAAHLVRAGHAVAVLARGQRAEAIRRDGLRIRGLVEFSTPVRVLRDPSELHSADTLIIATKTPGTAAALAQLRHVEVGTAFSIQNGTAKNELLADVFGAERVLGSLANTSGELLSSGEVVFTRNVNILVGELTGEASVRAREIASAIDAAGVRATAVSDIVSLEWSKFAAWVGLLVLAVTVRSVTWRYLVDPDSAKVLVRLTREMGELARALGIQLSDNGVLPAATLCKVSEEEAVALVTKEGGELKARAPDHRMSSLQDVDAGRPLEIHETLGYALEKAAGCGISMPVLDAFYRVIAATERVRLGAS